MLGHLTFTKKNILRKKKTLANYLSTIHCTCTSFKPDSGFKKVKKLNENPVFVKCLVCLNQKLLTLSGREIFFSLIKLKF